MQILDDAFIYLFAVNLPSASPERICSSNVPRVSAHSYRSLMPRMHIVNCIVHM